MDDSKIMVEIDLEFIIKYSDGSFGVPGDFVPSTLPTLLESYGKDLAAGNVEITIRKYNNNGA